MHFQALAFHRHYFKWPTYITSICRSLLYTEYVRYVHMEDTCYTGQYITTLWKTLFYTKFVFYDLNGRYYSTRNRYKTGIWKSLGNTNIRTVSRLLGDSNITIVQKSLQNTSITRVRSLEGFNITRVRSLENN